MTKKILLILTIFSLSFFAYAENGKPPTSVIDLQAIAKALETKRAELNKKEAELNAKEKRLNALEEELIKKEARIAEMRNEVSGYLDKIKKNEDDNLNQLASLYQNTKPKSAAAIIAKMDLTKAVQLFQRINSRAAGKIFSALGKTDPEYASKLSERLTPEKLKAISNQ